MGLKSIFKNFLESGRSDYEGFQLAGARESVYGDREQAELTQDSLDEQELSLDKEIREEQQKVNEERERLSRRRTQSTSGPWDINETVVRAIASREDSPKPVTGLKLEIRQLDMFIPGWWILATSKNTDF